MAGNVVCNCLVQDNYREIYRFGFSIILVDLFIKNKIKRAVYDRSEPFTHNCVFFEGLEKCMLDYESMMILDP